jgi:hypothetical protein
MNAALTDYSGDLAGALEKGGSLFDVEGLREAAKLIERPKRRPRR